MVIERTLMNPLHVFFYNLQNKSGAAQFYSCSLIFSWMHTKQHVKHHIYCFLIISITLGQVGHKQAIQEMCTF